MTEQGARDIPQTELDALNVAFALMSVVPLLICCYLLAAKFFSLEIFVGINGAYFLLAILIAVLGLTMGRQVIKGALEKLVKANARTQQLVGDLGRTNEQLKRELLERKQAEAALEESEDRFQDMANASPALISMTGEDGSRTFSNRAWSALTGQAPEKIGGKTWVDYIHPEDRQRCLEAYKTAVRNNQSFSLEYRLRFADGRYHWVEDVAAPRKRADLTFLGFISFGLDITARKESEYALIRDRETLERVNKLVAGREERIQELKSNVNDLLKELGRPARYEV